jgi:hypothetical protein
MGLCYIAAGLIHGKPKFRRAEAVGLDRRAERQHRRGRVRATARN